MTSFDYKQISGLSTTPKPNFDLRGVYIGAALATPFTALSSSQHKAPGFAGGYLLDLKAHRAPSLAHQRGKLNLPCAAGDWLQQALTPVGVELLPLTTYANAFS